MEKATKTPICDIARCLFFSHWHRVNKCTGTKRCRPSLLDTFKPGRLFSSTPICLPLLSLYLILSCLARGAEARTVPPASQVRGGARHARGAGRSLAAAATAVADRRCRRRGGARGPHRCRSWPPPPPWGARAATAAGLRELARSRPWGTGTRAAGRRRGSRPWGAAGRCRCRCG